MIKVSATNTIDLVVVPEMVAPASVPPKLYTPAFFLMTEMAGFDDCI